MADGSFKTFRIDEHPDFKSLPKDRCTLTMLRGPTPGAIQPVTTDELVLGRGEDVNGRIDDRGMSRRHARITRVLGQWAIEDLGSTNGTLVNGVKIARIHLLHDGDRVQLGEETLLKVSLQDATEAEAVQKLYDSAVRDPLTGAFNRGHFDERLAVEHAYALRHQVPLSVILLDLDYFKQVNDTHGHQAGDAVLITMAKTVQELVRAEDLFARYGGEEFAVIARNSDRAGGQQLAERIRLGIKGMPVTYEALRLSVTASLGLATMDPAHPYSRPEELLAAADRAVYQSKSDGRDRVSVA